MPTHLIRSSIALLAVATAACSYQAPDMTPEETRHLDQLTARMTTRCIGRYLVDLPDAFVLNSEARTEIEGVKIKVMPIKKLVFEHALERREAQLRARHMDGRPNRPFLKGRENTPVIAIGAVFNRAEASGDAEFGRTLELMAWKDGFQIEMSLDAIDGSVMVFDESTIGTPYEVSERRIFEKYKDRNDTPQKLAHLLKIYERLDGRPDTAIPTEQGVCFPNGFLRGAPTDAESIDLNYHLSSAEDVYFSFMSMSDIGPEENTLLERGNDINAMLKEVNGRTLRKGKRSIGGQEAEEWLFMRESDPGVEDYHLILEMNGLEGNAQQPAVIFEMSSGVSKPGPQPSLEEVATRKPIAKATLGEAESVALWDRVTSTLRPRPGAF